MLTRKLLNIIYSKVLYDSGRRIKAANLPTLIVMMVMTPTFDVIMSLTTPLPHAISNARDYKSPTAVQAVALRRLCNQQSRLYNYILYPDSLSIFCVSRRRVEGFLLVIAKNVSERTWIVYT